MPRFILMIVGVGVLLLVGASYAVFGPGLPFVIPGVGGSDDEPVACTMEAKQCPDGSYVGRVAPSCEFAPCPSTQPNEPQPEPNEGGDTVTVGFDITASIGGVTITPLELIEDSRCPGRAECVQAGTVRILVRLTSGVGTAEEEFTLGETVTTEAEAVTFVSVLPEMNVYQRFELPDYRLTFQVHDRVSE